MSILRPSAARFANISIVLSVVSGVLSFFFYVSASKPFIILTSAAPISIIAWFAAIAVIVYESLKRRTVSTRSMAAFVLAVAAYVFSDFVIIDYARAAL
jgi:hypothetical protein